MTTHLDHRYRPVPSSGCQRAVDGLGWPTTDVVRLDQADLGVRTRDEPVRSTLRALLSDHLDVDRPDAPPNFSLYVADPPGVRTSRQTTPLYTVFEGCSTMHRGRGIGELLRALVACLEESAASGDEPSLVVDAVPLLHERGEAALLPSSSRSLVFRNWAALADLGWRLAPVLWARLDRGSRVVVEPARLRPAGDRIRGLSDLAVLRGLGQQAEPGRYDVRYVFAAGRLGPGLAASRANAFLEMWARTQNRRELDNRAAFETVASMLQAPTIAAAPRHASALLRALGSSS